MEIAEIKSLMTGIKNSLDGLSSGMEMTEDTISEYKDRAKEFNQIDWGGGGGQKT